MRSAFPLIFAGFLSGSCHQSSTLTTSEEKAVVDSVRQTMLRYYRDVKAFGLIAEFNYLDSSSNFFWVPPGFSSAIDYDSVAFILKQNAPRYRSVDNALDTIRIIPLNGDIAVYTARLRSLMTDTTGAVSDFRFLETGVFVKRQNGWKLLSGQTSMINN